MPGVTIRNLLGLLWTPTGVLIVTVIVSFIISWFSTDKSQEGWLRSLVGIFSDLTAIVGLAFTFYQLAKIRRENLIIAKTSESTKNELFKLEKFGELAKGISLIQEAQSYLRRHQLEPAIIKTQDAKIVIIEAISLNTPGEIVVSLRAYLKKLNFLLLSLNRGLTNGIKPSDVQRCSKTLESVRDELVALKIEIKIK